MPAAPVEQPENPDSTPQETGQALEENVTGATHWLEGRVGKFGAAIGEALGNRFHIWGRAACH